MYSIGSLCLFSCAKTVLNVSQCTSSSCIYWMIWITYGGNILNNILVLVAHFFFVRSCTGKKLHIVFSNIGFQPVALCLFQLVAGVQLKFVWIFHCGILCVCYDMAMIFMWSNTGLIISMCLPFGIIKYGFRRDIYPKCNTQNSVSLVFVWTRPRVKSAFMWYQMIFLYYLPYI